MKDEYAKVGVPMLPVVRGEAETRARSCSTPCCCMPSPSCPSVRAAWRLLPAASLSSASASSPAPCGSTGVRTDARLLHLYLFSLAYLALLFCAMVFDVKL